DDRKAGRSQALSVYSGKTGGTYNADDGDGAPAWRHNGTTDALGRTFSPLSLASNYTFAAIVYNPANALNRFLGYGNYPNNWLLTLYWASGPGVRAQMAW